MFLAQGYWRKSCPKNVGEIDHRSQLQTYRKDCHWLSLSHPVLANYRVEEEVEHCLTERFKSRNAGLRPVNHFPFLHPPLINSLINLVFFSLHSLHSLADKYYLWFEFDLERQLWERKMTTFVADLDLFTISLLIDLSSVFYLSLPSFNRVKIRLKIWSNLLWSHLRPLLLSGLIFNHII